MKINLPALVNTVLILAIAAVCTYWFLQWESVRTLREPLVAVPAGDRVARSEPFDTGAAARLFGAARSGTPSRIRLVGVISEGGKGKGVALLAMDGQPTLAYRAGDPIDDSLTLGEVRADRVVIRSGTGTQEIRMPDRVAPTGIVPSR